MNRGRKDIYKGCCIYMILNTNTQDFYIGSSSNVHRRELEHWRDLKKNKHTNSHLQNSYNLRGKEAFIFFVLEIILDKKHQREIEQKWLDIKNPKYNICKKAICSLHSPESKAKISIANEGLIHPEWRRKSKSDATRGTVRPLHTEESKLRLSKIAKVKFDNGYKSSQIKKVYQYNKISGEFIKEWESARLVAKSLNLVISAISSCANGKSMSSGGYFWSYEKHDNIDISSVREKVLKERNRVKISDVCNKKLFQCDLNGNFIKEHPSVNSIAKELNVCNKAIGRCARGKSGQSAGYKWLYKEDLFKGLSTISKVRFN